MSLLSPSERPRLAAPLAKIIAGVVCAVFLVGAVHLYNRHIAADALLTASLARSEHLADSLSRLVRADRGALDSALVAARPDSAHLARVTPRIRIRAPTVIEVDTTVEPRAAPAPPVVVHVPGVVTDLMQTQARRIAQLEVAAHLAEQGWRHERALREERERQLAGLKRRRSRLGLKTGLVLGVIGTVMLVHAVAH